MKKHSNRTYSSLFLCVWYCVLLLTSCECKQFGQVSPIEFKCTLEAAQSTVYLKETDQVTLTLTITSDQEEGQKATYKLKQWKTSKDQKGDVDVLPNAPLNYGANKITYHPKSLGKHTLAISVTTGDKKGEDDKAKTAKCTLEVKDHQVVPYMASLQAEQPEILLGKFGSFVLNIQPEEVQAKDLDYKIKNWEVVQVPRDASNVVQGQLCARQDTSSAITAGYTLKPGKERLYYVLSGGLAGAYELRVTLTNEYGDERSLNAQFQIVEAAYEVTTTLIGDENRIGIEIDTEQENLKGGTWKIKSHRWSRGLEGDLLTKSSQVLHFGDNEVEFSLRAVDLREPARLTLEVQGPGEKVKTVNVDMAQACQQYLKGHLGGEDIRKLEEHLEQAKSACQYEIGDKDLKAKKVKRKELEKIFSKSKKLQERWTERITIIEHNRKYLSSTSRTTSRNRDARNSEAFQNKLEEESEKAQELLRQLVSGQEIMKGLIKALSDLRGKVDPSQALFKALREGNEENIDLFLNSPDLDIKVVDSEGRSLLHKAVQYGRLEAVKRLIEEGIDLDLKDTKGYTSSMIATKNGKLELLKLLHNNGADLSAVKKNNGKKEDFTLMHFAARYGHLPIVQFLLDNGRKCDVNIHGKNGKLPASGPRYWAFYKKHFEVERLLKQNGAYVWMTDGDKMDEVILEDWVKNIKNTR